MFIYGLLSFLCAHIVYIYMFYNLRQKNKNNLKIILFIIDLIYFSFLYQGIYEQGGYLMIFSVIIYIIVITLMVYLAFLNNNKVLSFGVLLFYISDATIALDKFIFKSTKTNFEYIIMITYYIAQICISKS